MNAKILATLLAISAAGGIRAGAQTYDTNGDYVQTFVGSGLAGYIDGVGQLTMFNGPTAVVADSQSNLFVWDSRNYRIRKITPDGTVSTFAGGGSQTTGVGTNVNLGTYADAVMTIDHNDTIWMVALYTVLYKITSGAVVTVTDLSLLEPHLVEPQGICADSSGNVYISDEATERIYRLSTNSVLSVFAGSGDGGDVNGKGVFTSFYSPTALAADGADNIYVWDSGGGLIRRIDQDQNVTTFAGKYEMLESADGVGTNAGFASIAAMCFDTSGDLIVTDFGYSVRMITPTTNVVTIAGSFDQSGYANGAGNLARFKGAAGVCVSGGTIYVADTGNQRIRSITNNPQPQVVSGANLGIGTYAGVTIIGAVGRTYQFQSSPDMNNWTTQATIVLSSSPFLWFDTTPISGNKFYRAVLLP